VTRGTRECGTCRRGTRKLALALWDPDAVQALQWDAGLAWSPLWTLVPEPDASPADIEFAARERKRWAAARAREARWQAEAAARRREDKAAALRAQAAYERDTAFRRAAILALRAADDGPPIWGPPLPPMMEPPPGTAVFRHAIAESGATCATADGAPRCSCGFYRMTWTATLDIV
jgi:hypothetical protein